MTDVVFDVDIDLRVGEDIVLVGFSPYLDGEQVPLDRDKPIRLTPGAHEIAVEVYLRPKERDALGGAVRMDVRMPLVLPRALAGAKGVEGGILLRLRDRGGQGTLADRVESESTLLPFTAAFAGAPPPPAVGDGQVMLAPNVGKGQRLSDVTKPPHRPMLPPSLIVAGASVWGLYKVCVDAQGTVSRVTTVRSALNPVLDVYWKSAIRTWRYQPYTISGRATPFCSPVRLQVSVPP